jgi:sterol desaturase/sphingolipid hydroxylase (fatty acid hydroxylase superfamily)
MPFAKALLPLVALAPPVIVVTLVRLLPERLWPAHPPRPLADGTNLFVWIAWLLGQIAFLPAAGALATLAVNAEGGGLIVLPSHGAGLIVAAAIYLVAMDFGEYVFHRAQHAIPALWRLHSLHHSDPAFDASTTVRHFWADPLLKTVSIWLVVGLLFKTAPPVVLIYVVISYYNYLIHSNTRIDFGRWSWVLNSPGYHRLHHSASPEHFDVNFAALLPIFDVVCGSYRPARPGERPRTGLDTGETPQGPLDVIAWPARRLLRETRTRLKLQAPSQA